MRRGFARLCQRLHNAQRIQRCHSMSELQRLHQELSNYYASLMHAPTAADISFHELMGQWLALPTIDCDFKESAITGVPSTDLSKHEHELQDIFSRAEAAKYPQNPWVSASGTVLADFLSKPMDHIRDAMQSTVEPAKTADATMDPSIPPFHLQISLPEQARLFPIHLFVDKGGE